MPKSSLFCTKDLCQSRRHASRMSSSCCTKVVVMLHITKTNTIFKVSVYRDSAGSKSNMPVLRILKDLKATLSRNRAGCSSARMTVTILEIKSKAATDVPSGISTSKRRYPRRRVFFRRSLHGCQQSPDGVHLQGPRRQPGHTFADFHYPIFYRLPQA